MRRMQTIIAAAALVVVAATPVLAQGSKGNGAPGGTHYNLNIVGVPKGKKATMTGTERHTIFVALGKGNTVPTDIYLEPRWEFEVCDGNGFDIAFGCDGAALGGGKVGAVFALPCNTNISQSGTIDPDGDGPLGPTPITTLNCDELDDDLVASYTVWSRALGQPGGSANMTTCATEVSVDANDDGTFGDRICSLENILLARGKGKSSFANVTNELTSLVACFDSDNDLDIECFRYALFRDEFTDWLWQFDNTGLRLAQLRFYLIED